MDKRVRFGAFDWCPFRRQLLADGERVVELGARAFDLLGVLIHNRDRVMSKGDLLASVWPDTVVAENNLTVQVSTLRKVLGEAAIATVPLSSGDIMARRSSSLLPSSTLRAFWKYSRSMRRISLGRWRSRIK